MIRILAVGQCGIELDGKRLSAESEVVFGLLLYLAARNGELVPRTELQSMFWPEISPTRGRHCLRQAAYRLRQLGIPLLSDNWSLGIHATHVSFDFTHLVVDGSCELSDPGSLGDIFRGYCPNLPTPFCRWIEDYRSRINHQIRQALVRALIDLRSRGRYREAEPIARACLASDPFNETATLALAESTVVLSGNRAEAMAILDKYIDELGDRSAEKRLALSAVVLRRRISERFVEQRYARQSDPPFVGRGDILQLLVEKMQEAVTGVSGTICIWGEAGIGKTRLLNELVKIAHVQGVRIERYDVSPNDPDRPLAMFTALLPRLLRLHGAIGISPDSYNAIQRFLQPSTDAAPRPPRSAAEAAAVFSQLRQAVCELFEVLTEDRPLGLLLDDMHWVDARSAELLADVVVALKNRGFFIACTSRNERFGNTKSSRAILERAIVRHIEPLRESDVEQLVMQIAEQRGLSITQDFVRRTVSSSGGNPLFVSELATHYAWNGIGTALPHNMQSLLQKRLQGLKEGTLVVFQTCALLGELASVERVCHVLGRSITSLAKDLRELEHAGLVLPLPGLVACRHQLLAREALKLLPVTIAEALHAKAALQLSRELEQSLDLGHAHACLLHFASSHNTRSAVRVAVEISRRLLDIGASKDALQLIEAADSLRPERDGLIQILATRVLISRASGNWSGVSHHLSQLESLSPSMDSIEDGELRRIAFDSRKYVGNVENCGASKQLQLLNSTGLSSASRKRIAMNALIACADDFEPQVALEVFQTHYRPHDSPSATLDDVVGALVYHTSFGSLDVAMEAASKIPGRMATLSVPAYRRTQLLRWCARPFHLAEEEKQAQSFLAEAACLAVALDQRGEQQECIAHHAAYALDLDDADLATYWLKKLSALAVNQPTAFGNATLSLLSLRHATLTNDAATASQCLTQLLGHQLPPFNRVRITMSACRVWQAILSNTPPLESDIGVLLELSSAALSAMDMDWNVSALCAAVPFASGEKASAMAVRFLSVRRPRFPAPSTVLRSADRIPPAERTSVAQ
jgi:DNA-binding SARP family transcriptional activator